MKMKSLVIIFTLVFFNGINISHSYAAVGDYIDRWSTSDQIYTLTWDGSYLWITDGNAPLKVKKYTAAGATTTDSFNLIAANDAPSGITWDGTYFLVLDSVDKIIYKYDASGTYHSNWSLDVSAGGGGASASRGILWDGSNFWVVDYGNDKVYQYNSSGTYTGTSWDTLASGNGGAIDIAWNNNSFWVTDYEDFKVYQYNASGTYQGDWTVNANNHGLRGITSNNDYIFIADPTDDRVYRYSATTTPPTITSVSSDKANGTYSVGEVIDIDITFSKAVTATSSVTVTLETGDTDRTCSFTVNNTLSASCNYTVQSGDISSDLNVSSISGYIEDQSGNAMTNFVPATNLATNKALVIDGIAPTVSALSPADNATNSAVGANLVLMFSKNVATSTGTITIKKASDDSTVETFNVASSTLITGSGTTYTINPSADLESDTTYYVQIDLGAFKDTSGNDYVGISDTTTWNFVTAASVETPEPKNTSSNSSGGISIYKRIGNEIEASEIQKAIKLINQEFNNLNEDQNPSLTKLNRLLQLLIEIKQKLSLGSEVVVIDYNESQEDVTEKNTQHSFSITRNLYLGDEGEDVRVLQLFLVNQDIGPSAKELSRVGVTGYFGNYTKNALGEFQLQAGIVPHVGYFGGITRNYLNENQ